MNVAEKMDRVVSPALKSLIGHEDADSTLLSAALDKVDELVAEGRQAIADRNAAKIAEAFPTVEEEA